MERLEFETKTNIKIFEKNPSRGGTPAKDNIESPKILLKTLEEPRFESAKSVRTFELTNCINVVNNKKEVRL